MTATWSGCDTELAEAIGRLPIGATTLAPQSSWRAAASRLLILLLSSFSLIHHFSHFSHFSHHSLIHSLTYSLTYSLTCLLTRLTAVMFVSRASPFLTKSLGPSVRRASSYIFNWGVGSSYQLGHEKFDTEDSYLSAGLYRQQLPRRLVNSGRIQKVCFGEGFGIGVTTNAQLLAWGKDYPGGAALPGDLRTPTLVDTEFAVADLASGNVHCGAVDSEGRAYLWGDNGNRMGGGGQLGNNSYSASASPTLVKSLVEAGVKVVALSCGEQHTLFLADDGSVYSCGMAEYGRLGILENWNTDVLVPQQLTEVFDGEKVTQVSAGFNHSMALTESGKVFTWGRNDQGQVR